MNCLKWLAQFHARHLNQPCQKIWETGTYWHLETRQEELVNIKNKELRDAASKIDCMLNCAKYKTIVHGDAKVANFLFNDQQVAAVDYQYVGAGVGVKDVAYFLSSVYNSDNLFAHQNKCLDYYFSELEKGLPVSDSKEIIKEWRELYIYAASDFYRFLMGWSPNHYKLGKYSDHIIKEVLKCI